MTVATKYNPNTVGAIVEVLRRGHTRRVAAGAAHISERTMSEAECIAERFHGDNVLRAANTGNWIPSMTWLERRRPADYGRVDRAIAVQLEEVRQLVEEFHREGLTDVTAADVLRYVNPNGTKRAALPEPRQ
jgi:hypothetical protein